MRYTFPMPGFRNSTTEILKRAFPEMRNYLKFRIAEDDGEQATA
jgi:hypothetical protein